MWMEECLKMGQGGDLKKKKWDQGGDKKWDYIEPCKNLLNNLIFS